MKIPENKNKNVIDSEFSSETNQDTITFFDNGVPGVGKYNLVR